MNSIEVKVGSNHQLVFIEGMAVQAALLLLAFQNVCHFMLGILAELAEPALDAD
ncbi:MAG: hypothetical protein ABI977_16580 [Acidobacteriota bacterium]